MRSDRSVCCGYPFGSWLSLMNEPWLSVQDFAFQNSIRAWRRNEWVWVSTQGLQTLWSGWAQYPKATDTVKGSGSVLRGLQTQWRGWSQYPSATNTVERLGSVPRPQIQRSGALLLILCHWQAKGLYGFPWGSRNRKQLTEDHGAGFLEHKEEAQRVLWKNQPHVVQRMRLSR